MKISNTKQLRMTVQLWIATILTLAGIVLVFAGFWVQPLGEIHNSVLVAFGEMSAFAGGLFGVDYSYRLAKRKEQESKDETNTNE